MNSLKYEKFTIQDAINIQTDQLANWQKILNEKTYLLVLAEVAKRNASKDLKDGYDVFRGSSIESFIHGLYR